MIRFSKRSRIPAIAVLTIAVWVAPVKAATAAEAGQELFKDHCAACHTIGKGKLVGPDLAGVTSRREAGWLQRQIKEPDRLIAEKDPIALQLLREADDVEMPPPEISSEQVVAIIAFLKSTEQQGEGSLGPAAILGSKTKEVHGALPVFRAHPCGASLEGFTSFDPTRKQKLCRGVT